MNAPAPASGLPPARARRLVAGVVTALIVGVVWWVIAWRGAAPAI